MAAVSVKRSIPDPTSKNLPNSGIRIPTIIKGEYKNMNLILGKS